MIAGKISFEISNNLSELNTLHQNLEELGKSIELPKKCIFEINLAVEELFTNIIAHGYKDSAEHWIKVDVWQENGMLIIRIEDDGVPFNPVEFKKPDLKCPVEEREIGGLGIHLTKQFTCEIAYERCGDKNVLTLKRSLMKT